LAPLAALSRRLTRSTAGAAAARSHPVRRLPDAPFSAQDPPPLNLQNDRWGMNRLAHSLSPIVTRTRCRPGRVMPAVLLFASLICFLPVAMSTAAAERISPAGSPTRTSSTFIGRPRRCADPDQFPPRPPSRQSPPRRAQTTAARVKRQEPSTIIIRHSRESGNPGATRVSERK